MICGRNRDFNLEVSDRKYVVSGQWELLHVAPTSYLSINPFYDKFIIRGKAVHELGIARFHPTNISSSWSDGDPSPTEQVVSSDRNGVRVRWLGLIGLVGWGPTEQVVGFDRNGVRVRRLGLIGLVGCGCVCLLVFRKKWKYGVSWQWELLRLPIWG